MKYVWKALGIYLAFLFQSLIFEKLEIFSCSPDLLITVVIIVAVSESFMPAAMLGAFAGLLNDVMYGEVFGINILLYMYIALLVSLAADKRIFNSPLIMSWVCFISIAILEIVIVIMETAMGKNIAFGLICAGIFVKGIFAALFAMLYVLIVLSLQKKKKDNQEECEIITDEEATE